jgi:hypothetical protein
MLMDDPRKRSIAMLNYITEKSLTHKMKRKKNDCYQKKTATHASLNSTCPSDVRDEVDKSLLRLATAGEGVFLLWFCAVSH